MVLRTGTPEEAGMSSAGVKRAEDVVQRLVDTGNTPSVVALIARDGIIVSHKAYGTNGTADGAEPLKADAVFPMYSITKSFTAVCVMMLVEQGKIGLNRPISEYLPAFGTEDKAGICVHHLLTHTSGLDDDAAAQYLEKNKDNLQIPEEWHGKEHLYCLAVCPPAHKPGTVMSYSGAYNLLGDIIEKASGMPYVGFVEKRLFQPLGMKDSCYLPPDDIKKRLVKRDPPALWHEWLNSEESINNTSAAGGALSTVMDTTIFCNMLQNMGIYNGIRILSPVSVKTLTQNHIPGVSSEYRGEVFPEAYWGLGFGINGTKKDGGDLFSPEAYSHWGAAGVFFCVDPTYRTIQIYFSVEVDHQVAFRQIYADAFNNAALAAIEVL
jgi:CubicO group peptidase (beta-lactamase class C family)